MTRLREPRDALAAAIAGLGLLATYWIAQLGPWSPKRGVGLGLGVLAAALYVFGMLYPARRPRARPFGNARVWLRLHLWLGALALLAALLHSGVRWPSGGHGRALLTLSALVTLTGLAGVWLQRILPAALAEGVGRHALLDRIPALQAALLAEADSLTTDAGDAVAAVYAGGVRQRLATPDPRWTYLRDVRATRERALASLRELSPFVEGEDAARVERLVQLTVRKLELDAQVRLQGVLRSWVVVHAVPAALLLGLLAIHIGAWVLY